MQEKQINEELIADSQGRATAWLKRAEEMLPFAQTAQEQFETGILEDKRYVLSCLGSNLILSRRKLRMHIGERLSLIQEIAPEVQTLHKKLEPQNCF